MSKLSTKRLNVRILLSALLLALSSQSLFAGDQAYYWFYTNVTAYPTGGGTVYVSHDETSEADRKYAAESEDYTKAYLYAGSTTFYAYAKPNDGYIFLGWKEIDQKYWDDLAAEPEKTDLIDYLSKEFVSYDAETDFYISTEKSTDNDDVDAYNYIPDNAFAAVFGHVKLMPVTGQDKLGTSSIDEPAVEIGDFTYLRAYPADSTVTFLYWIDDEGNTYAGNAADDYALEIQVKRNITYRPVFSSPNYVTYDFGEGGYKVMSNPTNDIDYDNNVCHHILIAPYIEGNLQTIDHYDYFYKDVEEEYDTIIDGEDAVATRIVQELDSTAVYKDNFYTILDNNIPSVGYILNLNYYGYGTYANQAALVYGKGLCSFELSEGQEYLHADRLYLKPSGSEGTDIATLPQDGTKYYIWDEAAQVFKAVTEGVVPAYSGYLALPADVAANQPDVLPLVDRNRYVNVDYTATLPQQYEGAKLTVDVEGILSTLGVESLDDVNIYAVQRDGTLDADYKLGGASDGWRNAAGDWSEWAKSESRFYVKADFSLESEQLYEIGCHRTTEPTNYAALYRFAQKSDESNFVTLSVTLHYEKAPIDPNALAYDLLNIEGTKNVDINLSIGAGYGAAANVDVPTDEIIATLGVSSLSDLTIFAVESDGSLDSSYGLGSSDGWRDVNGDWAQWSEPESQFYVKADFSLSSGQLTDIGCHPDHSGTHLTSAITYTAKYAFVAGTSADDNKAYILSVNLVVGGQDDAISAVGLDAASSANTYDITGRKVVNAAKGLYIVGGQKVLVK